MVIIKGEEYLGKTEFAEALNVSYTTINNWIARGIINPAYSVNKYQYFTQEQVDAYWRGEFVPVRK